MKITIGRVPFEVRAVPEDLRSALMADPMLVSARAIPVWAWDKSAGTGKALVPLTPKGAVPLPNGLAFFVPRKLPDGGIVRNESSSKVMMKRFVEAVEAQSLQDVLKALQSLLKLPQKTLPLDHFAPLKDHASFEIAMQTLFNVVELAEPSRNLSAYVFVPGQVRFIHRLGDDAGPGAQGAIDGPPPVFLIPTWSKPNHHVRMVALTRRAKDLQPLIEAMKAGDTPKDQGTINAFAATIAELQGLARPPEKSAVH